MINDSLMETGNLILKKKAGVFWVRDNVGVIVVHPREQDYAILTGLEAEVWDLIVLNRPFREILFFVVSTLGGTEETARQHLRVIFQKWSDQGFISLEAESI
jgi:hypothetical protein